MSTPFEQCNYQLHEVYTRPTGYVNTIYTDILLGMEETLGAFIKRKRTERGWNQTDLARESGVDRAYLSQIESGKVALPGATVRRQLAQGLGIRHIDMLIAAGEISIDEVEGLPAPDSPWVAALRPVLDNYDGDIEQLVRVIRGIVSL